MKIFEKQGWHLLSLIALLAGMYFLVDGDVVILSGSLWGWSTSKWLILTIAVPIAHQLYVLVCWRLELHYKLLTSILGPRAFRIYTVGFFILFTGRMFCMICLAIANKATLPLAPLISYIIAGVLAMLSIYSFYSVIRYFGIDRAAGIDHFVPNAGDLPFVKQGIFKYTNNGMYIYALLMLYVPGLIGRSSAAIMAAVFSLVFIWGHYYFTEMPDMVRIYGQTPGKSN